MLFGKKAIDLTDEIARDPLKYSNWVTNSVGLKADRYKRLSRRYGILSVLLSLSVVFILSFEGECARILAAVVTILNSVFLAWFQLEKPYDRWRLYRKYHRIFEAERVRFINNIEPYNGSHNSSLLFTKLTDLQIKLHEEWDGLVPSSDEIQKLQEKK